MDDTKKPIEVSPSVSLADIVGWIFLVVMIVIAFKNLDKEVNLNGKAIEYNTVSVDRLRDTQTADRRDRIADNKETQRKLDYIIEQLGKKQDR